MTPDGLAMMKRQFLYELSRRIVTIPSDWSSVRIYDILVSDGTAEPVINVSPLMRGYTITEEGWKALSASPEPLLFGERTMSTEQQKISLSIVCPSCGALAGVQCTKEKSSRSGGVPPEREPVHRTRYIEALRLKKMHTAAGTKMK